MVALTVADCNTRSMWRNDHSESHSPIRWRSSWASVVSWPAVTYHTAMTLCMAQTHGASFSTLAWQKCCGASMSMTCLLARNIISILHLREYLVTTLVNLLCRSVVIR